jgi:peptide/nickel transport system substrate-binding protein
MNRAISVTAGLAIGALALVACSGQSTPQATSSSSAGTGMLAQQPAASGPVDAVQWAYYAVLPTLDPAHSMSREAGQIIGNLCDTLQRTDPDLSVSDNLATLTRTDDTHYELAIADGATFWDGKPVTAADVVYSLTRHMDPAVGSDFAEFFVNVDSITATDQTHVAVAMKHPDILFEKALGTMAGAVMEKSFSEKAGDSLGSLQGDLMCSGPFRIASSDPASKIVLERNDDYWRSDTKPLAATVTINYLQDGSIAAAALQSGEVSGMYSFPSVSMDQLTTSGAGDAYAGLSNSTFSFVVGGLEGNPLDDVRLRETTPRLSSRRRWARRARNGRSSSRTRRASARKWARWRSTCSRSPTASA